MRYLFLAAMSFFASRKTAVKCGHSTRMSGRVSAFGYSVHTRNKANQDGTVDYCLECLGKMAIQCGCGHPIFIGDRVILYYSPVPARAVILGNGPGYVGCIYCSDSAANICGSWVPGEDGKGCVRRRPNGYEQALGVAPSSS